MSFFSTKSECRKPQILTELPKYEHKVKFGTRKGPAKPVSPTNNLRKTTPLMWDD